ncbi:MAG TPA: polymer-forming cytoskeletal protein [Terriglobales bacterium]|nr:polymer-forming cytoskeletal protein [Terriglobales bacterium]
MEGSQQTADDSPPPPRFRTIGAADVSPASGRGAINLGPRDILVGRLVFDGDLRVQGSMEGEATLSGDLQVDSQGTVKAKVQARNLTVRGTVDGEVSVKERLVIAGSGTVTGSVRVSRLVLEDGALLNGTITMERSAPGTNGRPADR